MFKRAVVFAIKTIFNNKVFFIKLFLIGLIINIVSPLLLKRCGKTILPYNTTNVILIVVTMNLLFFIFTIKMGIDFYNTEVCQVSDLLKIDIKLCIKVVVGFLISVVLVMLPATLFVVPGLGWIVGTILMIILTIRLIFVNHLIIDDDLNFFKAVPKSINITAGYSWKLFFIEGFSVLLMLIAILISGEIKNLVLPSNYEVWSFISSSEGIINSSVVLSTGIDSVFRVLIAIVGNLILAYIYKEIKKDYHN